MLDKDDATFAKPLSAEAKTSFTLPSRFYTDPAIFELEKTRIFYRTWQYVCHLSLLQSPGDYATQRICDQNVFVIRGDDGVLRGFYNVCQHRAHELLPDGQGNVARAIVCPYHAWTFQKDGQLRGAPRTDQRPGFKTEDYTLRAIQVEEFLGCAFVNLDPDAAPLAQQAAGLAEDIRALVPFFDDLAVPQASEEPVNAMGMAAGWKVVVDNYVECYHCDHAHPAFADLICMDDYAHDIHGLWARQLGPTIRADNSAYAMDGAPEGADDARSVFWYLWPNMTINMLPGARQVNFASVLPRGTGRSDFTGHTATADGALDAAIGAYLVDVLVPEDVALCESVQRGLRSFGYDQGPFVADDAKTGRGEHVLHHFHRLVQEAFDL